MGSINRMGVTTGSLDLGGEVQTAEFLSKRLWVLAVRAAPVLCPWCLSVAAL